VSQGPWSVLSLTVLPPDKPGRNPSVGSEEQEEECLQAHVCSSLQQQPSQTGQLPAVRAPAFPGSGGQGRAERPEHEARRRDGCAGGCCVQRHRRCAVGETRCLGENPGPAASRQETEPLMLGLIYPLILPLLPPIFMQNKQGFLVFWPARSSAVAAAVGHSAVGWNCAPWMRPPARDAGRASGVSGWSQSREKGPRPAVCLV